MKPRLLIYGDDPETGGAAASTHRLAIGLARRGDYEVFYAVTRADEARIAEREQAGVRHRFIPYDTLKVFYFATRDRAAPAAVFHDVAPDLAIFADSAPDSLLAAKDVAAALGVPYVTVKHMVLPDNPWTQAPWVRAEIARTSRLARCVVAVSEASRRLLSSQFDMADATMTVVPNSCPDRFFQPRDDAARQRLRDEWGAPPGVFVVMTLARILWLKGHEMIVWLAYDLARRGLLEHYRFVWVGDAADAAQRDRLTAKIASWGGQRFFLHLGARDDVSACLDAADALLAPSLSEGMPLSVIEAMARGLPVAGSAVGGVPEVIGDCGALLTSPLVSPEATVREAQAALEGWRTDPAAARALGDRAAARARSLFSEDRQIAAMAAVVDRALYPAGDYVSPGRPPVRADRRFPFLVAIDRERLKFPGARPDIPHTQYADGRDIGRLLLNRDEATLLHDLARRYAGSAAVMLGGECGWAAWHMAAAGVSVDVLEPALADAGPRAVLLKTVMSAQADGLADIRLHIGTGASAVLRLAERDGRRWALAAFNRPGPAPDLPATAEACARVMTDDAAMIFCFAAMAADDVAAALTRLQAAGWRVRLYDTAEMLAVAWRGAAAPPDHQPDPAVNWPRPPALAGFAAP